MVRLRQQDTGVQFLGTFCHYAEDDAAILGAYKILDRKHSIGHVMCQADVYSAGPKTLWCTGIILLIEIKSTFLSRAVGFWCILMKPLTKNPAILC